MSRPLLLVLLTACGRIGFDTTGISADAASDAIVDDGTYRGAVLADRPVGYWRFGHPTRVIDEIGGPDGVTMGLCAFGVPGALSPDSDLAIDFDGTCAIDLGPGFAFLGAAPFTVEAWVASVDGTRFEHVLSKELRDLTDPLDGWSLVDSPDGVYFERVSSMTGVLRSTSKEPLGLQFTHVAGVFDGAMLRLHVDGDEVAAAPDDQPALPYSASVLAGAARRGNGALLDLFEGTIDDVAIYDHALPPARILRHYQIGTGQD